MDVSDAFSDASVSAIDSEQVSSATSPSISECATPFQFGPNLSKEAQAVIANLSNFVPLGCLCFEDFMSSEDRNAADPWQDVALPPVLPFDNALSSNLEILQRNGWIRVQSSSSQMSARWIIYRIYLLYSDVGLSCIKRDESTSKLKNAVRSLLDELDVSPLTWEGRYCLDNVQRFSKWATKDEEDPSLFYVFNTLPSPAPSAAEIKGKYEREALEDLLDINSNPLGLRTKLYPYQRRSAGIMLEREATSKFELDPRLEVRQSPSGSKYYYDCRKIDFQRDPQYYEACSGGILAETMGLGKTVICLALILATKHHLPNIPPEHTVPVQRHVVGSLADMAAAAINLKSVPWKVELERIKYHCGDEMSTLADRLWRNPATYDIPQIPLKWCRTTKEKPPHRMTLAFTTLIVVPPNLCKQWESEIKKHVEDDGLKLLVMQDRRKPIPNSEDLRTYDVILFSRNRFDMESRHGVDDQGRRPTNLVCRCPYVGSSRQKDCTCLRDEDLYHSPLKDIHFKRLIVDEGHFFSHSSSNAASVADKLITADHRWIVSGTPAKDLLGVEVDMSATENFWQNSDTNERRQMLLEQRRYFSNLDRTGAIESLGALTSRFLKVRPWSESKVNWKDYIFRHEDHSKLTFSSFSVCLRKTLQSIVVKTQPDDVERDIGLPPLSHTIVRLDPSFYDKVTANLFTLVLLANAITSEREDRDYIFHKDSGRERQQLISNLRKSAFFWTGFGQQDVRASIKNSTGYLAKEGTKVSPEDRQLLQETLVCTEDILNSEGWASMSQSNELGVFVDKWPEASAEHWSFDTCREPLMTGISHLLEAQKFVNLRLGKADPGDGLSGAGVKAMASLKHNQKADELEVSQSNDAKLEMDSQSNSKLTSPSRSRSEKPVMNKAGIPTSSLDGEPSLRRRASFPATVRSSKRKASKEDSQGEKMTKKRRTSTITKDRKDEPLSLKSENPGGCNDAAELPQGSPYLQSRVVGTSSAKMSYLISQILKHYKDEKILIFYQGDNIAYYIAQVLDLFHIRHEIYAKSLAAHLKAAYVVRFDQEPQDRVLLMDVTQAAFGLNLSSASRIYFVNPVCRPDVEAQAIKRAHRIGQHRPVFVETLVLRGSIEEKMLERSNRMTRAEHQNAKVLEDDGGMRQIIQSARVIPINESEKSGRGQMAPLQASEQLWARDGWINSTTGLLSRRDSRSDDSRRRATMEDVEPGYMERIIADNAEHRPQVLIKRISEQMKKTGGVGTSHNQGSNERSPLDRWSRRISLSDSTPHMLTLPSMANHDDTLITAPPSSGSNLVAGSSNGLASGPPDMPLSMMHTLHDD